MSVPSGARAITTSTVASSRPMIRSIHSPPNIPGLPQSKPSAARNRTVSSRSSTTRPMWTKSVTPGRWLSIEVIRLALDPGLPGWRPYRRRALHGEPPMAALRVLRQSAGGASDAPLGAGQSGSLCQPGVDFGLAALVADRRGRLEALERQVDADRRLPDDLRDREQELRRPGGLEGAEHHGDPRQAQQRAADEPEHRQPAWQQAGGVHQVAEDQSVADADDEAGAEQEGRVVDGDERLTQAQERAVGQATGVLTQRHDRKDADDADSDERALDDARRDEAERE